MDLLDKIARTHALMLESHRDFMDLIEELRGDRGNGGSADFSMDSYYEDSVSEEEQEVALEPGSRSYNERDQDAAEDSLGEEEDYCDDFPKNRIGFDYRSINFEDPSFWGGKEIGIPMGLLVHGEDDQGKLLPIRNGMFVDEEY